MWFVLLVFVCWVWSLVGKRRWNDVLDYYEWRVFMSSLWSFMFVFVVLWLVWSFWDFLVSVFVYVWSFLDLWCRVWGVCVLFGECCVMWFCLVGLGDVCVCFDYELGVLVWICCMDCCDSVWCFWVCIVGWFWRLVYIYCLVCGSLW